MAIGSPPTAPPTPEAPPSPAPPTPPPLASAQRPSWWQRQSKFQKFLLVVGAIVVALFVIGRFNQPATPSATQALSSASQSAATTAGAAPTASAAVKASARPSSVAPP